MSSKLENLYFSRESLESYYDSFFHDDLRRFFKVEKDENGAEVINNLREKGSSSGGIILRLRKPTPVTAFAEETSIKNEKSEIKEGTIEEELYFMALVSFMYSVEFHMVRKVDDADEKSLINCLNSFGFPWIKNIKNYCCPIKIGIDYYSS